MIGSGEIVGLLLGLAIMIGLFLLFRRVVLWYWGINAMLAHLDVLVQQNNQLLELLRAQQADVPQPTITASQDRVQSG